MPTRRALPNDAPCDRGGQIDNGISFELIARAVRIAAALIFVCACSSSTDVMAEATDKSASCASTFGSALTNAFGRLDGTIVAVVPPNDQSCAMPNSTHLVIQVMMGGAVYRMVVDVLSDQGNPDVFENEIDAPLVGDPWSDGWHDTASLDYVTTLARTSTSFVEMNQATVVDRITNQLNLDAHVSVFATSAGEPSSAHLVHRNLTNQDGAIVINPDASGNSSPHWILIRFDEQSF
jgi:hypothetical protein